MVIKVRYTPKGTPYIDTRKATSLEALELYKQMQPKNGTVIYRPHDARSRHRTAPTADPAGVAPNHPAANSTSSPAAAGPAAAEQADRPPGKE